jgi:transcriptional regulator with XRE-family HTH domain
VSKYQNRIAVLRQRQKLTLDELATLTGFHITTVCRHQSEKRPLTRAAAQAYAKIFKCDMLEIFMDPDELFLSEEDGTDLDTDTDE